MRTQTIAIMSLFVLAGLAVGCSEAADGAADGPVGEQSEALTTAANMAWADPAHDAIALIPGTDSESVTDDAPGSHEVYQVLATPRPNTQNGSVTVSKFWADAAQASCANRSLSARVLRTTATGGIVIWSELKEADVTSTYDPGHGEFPQPGCRAAVSVPFASTTTKLRVMAQARTKSFFNGLPFYVNSAATVSARGTSPAPHLTASMTIASDG